MPRHIEAAEQRTVIQFADLHWWGPLLLMVPNGAFLAGNPKERAIRCHQLKAEGLRPGVPDLLLAYPYRELSGCWIEMKRPDGGQPSAEQRRYHAMLVRAGYCVHVCHGADSAIAQLKTYLGYRLTHPPTDWPTLRHVA